MLFIMGGVDLVGHTLGEECNHDTTFCDLSHTCVNQVCTLICQHNDECPDPWRCVEYVDDSKANAEPIKKCDVPNRLEKNIRDQLSILGQKLDRELKIDRKKQNVFQAILVHKITHKITLSPEIFNFLTLSVHFEILEM